MLSADWITSHEHWTIRVSHKVPHRHFHTSVEKMGWNDRLCRDRDSSLSGLIVSNLLNGRLDLYKEFRLPRTGITAYLKNGGTLEKAAALTNHASTRTTQLYDRRQDEMSLNEVEKIAI